jgi:peptide/nickel transport system substrate-binding protein
MIKPVIGRLGKDVEDWERTPTGMLYGEPKPKYVLFLLLWRNFNKVIAQANHNLDMTDLTIEAFRALTQRNPYTRGIQNRISMDC